jgi:hypothetical protein
MLPKYTTHRQLTQGLVRHALASVLKIALTHFSWVFQGFPRRCIQSKKTALTAEFA